MSRDSRRVSRDWDDAPLPYQSIDAEGRILQVNSAWEQYTGYAADEVVGMPLRDLISPDRRDDYDQSRATLLATGRLMGRDLYLQRKDGARLMCRIFGRLVGGDDGHTSRCMLVDVAAQLGAEQALVETEERYEALFSLAPTPIVIHNGREVLLANEAAARFLGFGSPADMVGGSVIGFVHPDDRPRVAERVKRMLTEGVTVPLLEERFVRADGSIAIGDTVASPVVFAGQPAIHVVVLDTSERKAAEKAAQESEARFSQLFENNMDPIVVHDGSHVILANAAARRRFGADEDVEASGWEISQFIRPESSHEVQEAIEERLGAGTTRGPLEISLVSLDGLTWTAEVSTSKLELEGKTVLQSVFRDLTERNRQEAELVEYRDQLEQLVRERTETLYAVKANLQAITAVIGQSVEIRDPYTAGHQRRVAGLAVAIARKLGIDDDAVEEISVASLLHDIGKLGVPAEILSKPALLSALEYEFVKQHAEAGYQIIASAQLGGPVAEIVYQHHERLDGSGYPRGLGDADLLMGARILMVADVVEAMMSHRPYRPALGIHAALEEISANSGKLYDPEVVSVCTEVMQSGFEFEKIAG